MLPSGNDAAYTVAEYFSNVIFEVKYKKMPQKHQEKIRSFAYQRHPIRFFLNEMNCYAKELGMKESYFDSPHGLMNRFNVSTVADMAKLMHVCMKIPMFRKVVSTTRIDTRAKESVNKVKTRYMWKTTNKLLGTRMDQETGKWVARCEGVKGCKTGITPAAGPCFAGYFERRCFVGHPTLEQQSEKFQEIMVIVLNSKTMDQRWVEIPQLVDWFLEVKSKALTDIDLCANKPPHLRPTSSSQRKSRLR